MMSRRDLMRLAVAAAVSMEAPEAADAAAAGPALRRAGDAWELRGPHTRDVLRLSARSPIFEFDGFRLGGPEAGEGRWTHERGVWIGAWRVAGPRAADLRTALTIDARGGLVRRSAEVRLDGGEPALLRTVVLDEVDADGQAPAARTGPQSYPVLWRSFFAGVEYPIAFAEAAGERVRLGHRPGTRVPASSWYRARTAVYGMSAPGAARRAFEAYIAARRPAPHGLHFNYNSWWTSPVPYTEKDVLDLIQRFRKDLFEPYGISPDTFCIDMGWAKSTTIWRIDPALFPKGFEAVRAACHSIRSRPGLWISPSARYAQALDLAWARGAGYEADDKACLAGPRYQAAFRDALIDHTRRYGIRHVKFDGYTPTCDSTEHGHEPGIYSAERIAEGLIAVFRELRLAAPDLWMEPTCFGYDPSPWWLDYVNSVIGTYGDDAPYGRVPCPVYRESYTTARDFYNLQGARNILAPIAAQEVLGVVHQTAEDLHNDAVVTVLRGHQFVPLYVNPAFMSPRRWEFLAAIMAWARRNAPVLAETRAIDPDGWRGRLDVPMPRAPYGYGHWHDGRGLVCLRNPWIEPAVKRIVPARDLGAPAGGPALSASLIYPERRRLAVSVRPTDTVSIALAPYETAVVELAPARRGARPIAAPAPPMACSAALRARASWFEPDDSGPRFGPDYTRLVPADGPCPRVRISGTVDVPRGDRHELLVLVEGAGAVEAPCARIAVGGREVAAEVVSSDAGWRASGGDPPENWLWLIVPLAPGRAEIEADLLLADGKQTVAAWVAGRRRVPWRKLAKVDGTSLPGPEERWLGATRAFGAVAYGPGLPRERGPAPVVRIGGVYLDALEPVEWKQGWGKLERNRSVWEKPMTIGGKRYLRGVGTHAPARIAYALDGRYRRFQAWAGADEATGPTITMEAHVDGKAAWKSGLLTRGMPAAWVDVDVRGALRLELFVGDGGNGNSGDHADWADAVLLR